MNYRYRSARAGIFVSALASLVVCAGADKTLAPIIATPSGEQMIAGEVLVRLRPTNAPSRLSAMGTVKSVATGSPFVKITLRRGMTIPAALQQLRTQPNVQCAAPNYRRSICSDDPEYLANLQYAIPRMQIDQAWSAWKPCKQIIIGVVDTGINASHSDLRNMMLRDSEGTIIGYNAVTNTEIEENSDGHGHGTFCAGEANAETHNNNGVAAFAYNGGAASETYALKLMPLKIFDPTGNGTDEDLIEAMYWGLDHGVNVFSMSLGGPGNSPVLDAAAQDVWNAGALIVAAAGNGNTSTLFYPAACPQVIAVAATNTQDQFAGFSNHGSWVHVAAPGVNVRSTTASGGYGNSSGTSMACPLVAGTAAFLWAQNPTLNNSALRTAIFSNTDALPAGQTKTIQFGRVNTRKAQIAVKYPPLSGKIVLDGWQKVDMTPYRTGNLVRVFVFPANSMPTGESQAIAFANVPLDERGVYALPSGVVADGIYRIGIKPLTAPGLAALVPGNIVLSNTVPPTVPNLTIKLGDSTRDGAVDYFDLSLLIAHYNKIEGNAGYSLDADSDGDGANDINDLILLIRNYNKRAEFLP